MSHDKHAPQLPEIQDEAPDTPGWVPALGLGLFALITIMLAIRLAWTEANPVAKDAGAEAGAPAAGSAAP